MKSAAAYAEALRKGAPRPRAPNQPRNARAIATARNTGATLVVSLVGDTTWPLPTVYCDEDRRYDWATLLAGISKVVIAAKHGIAFQPLARTIAVELFVGPSMTYPLFVDVERRECAYFVPTGGGLFKLWPLRHESTEWQDLFG